MSDANEERAFFIITGLAQPIKLKLATKSSLKNLFTHVPFSQAEGVIPEFYWQDLRLDPHCCPVDYGMLPGPDHIHTIECRMPIPAPKSSSPAAAEASARVYNAIQPISLLGAITQSPQPVTKSASPSQSQQQRAVTAIRSPATERLIEELQYAVKVHSESSLRLNEQLLAARKDLAEVTDVMSRENRKLTERVLDLEEQLRVKEQLRHDQSQQSLMSIHQHFTAFEQEREARREEVDSLQKLVKAVSQEKDVFAQRNEELSKTLHQRDEEWAADLEHFTQQLRKNQADALQREAKIAELSSVHSENKRLNAELRTVKEIADREPQYLQEIEHLQQQIDALQSHLIAANAATVSMQTLVADKEAEWASERESLRAEIAHERNQNNEASARLEEALQRLAARPSDAQLHAKMREVVAQNQRLLQLIKQPSSAVTQRSVSPSLPPGVTSPAHRERSVEMQTTHWNEQVRRVASEERPVTTQSAMERMYPPADRVVEPTNVRLDGPGVPRRSQRVVVPEEPRVVPRSEMRKESIRVWADENAAGLDEARRQSSPNIQRKASAVAPRELHTDDVAAMRSVGSMRQPVDRRASMRSATDLQAEDVHAMRTVQSIRQPSPPHPSQLNSQQPVRQESPQQQFGVSPNAARQARAKSMGDLRMVSGATQSYGLTQTPSFRATDESGRPRIPRRASVSPDQDLDGQQVYAAPAAAQSLAADQPVARRQSSAVLLVPTTQGGEVHSDAFAGGSEGAVAGTSSAAASFRRTPSNVQHSDGDGGAPRVPLSRANSLRTASPGAQPTGGDMAPSLSAANLRGSTSGSMRASPSAAHSFRSQPSAVLHHPQSSGGEEEAHVVVEFEDAAPQRSTGGEADAPRTIDTKVLPPHSSFVAHEDVIVEEDRVTDSMVVEPSSMSVSTSTTTRGDARPRMEPEIEREAVPFKTAKSMFVNSAPVAPDDPYMAQIRRAASAPRVKQTTGATPGNQPRYAPEAQELDVAAQEVAVANHDDLNAGAAGGAPISPPPEVPSRRSPRAGAQAGNSPRRHSPPQRTPVSPGGSNLTPGGSPRVASMLVHTPRPTGNNAPREPQPRSAPAAGPEEVPFRSIAYDVHGPSAEVFHSVPSLFDEAAAAGGARTAIVFGQDATKPPITIPWKRYHKAAKQFARSIVADGHAVGSKIAILGENSAEYLLSFVGILSAGCIPVLLPQNNSINDLVTKLNQVQATMIVAESWRLTRLLLNESSRIPSVARIIVAHGAIPPRSKETHDSVYAFEEFLDLGVAIPVEDLASRCGQVSTAEHLAAIAFTSGATQQPRAVMLSHDNLQFSAWAFACGIGLSQLTEADGNVRLVSHMPLSEVTYAVLDIILPMVALVKFGLNVIVHFGRSTNVPDLVHQLQATKPTIFASSPTVWKALLAHAEAQCVEDHQTRGFLGLVDCKLCLWGGTPWNHGACLSVCDKKNLDLREFYSCTECTGIAVTSTPRLSEFASCGAPLPGTRCTLAPDHQRDLEEQGELVVSGRNVAMGYHQLPAMTQQTFIHDGTSVLTGDVVAVTANHIFFVGRTTDFVANADNEYVHLRKIEDGILAACPALSYVVAFGSNRRTNICLVSFKTKRDENGKPTEELDAAAAQLHPSLRTAAEARQDATVQKAIGKALATYNNGPSCDGPSHKVARFGYFQVEPSYDSDELTVDGKLKRATVNEKYHQVIDKLYEQQAARPKNPKSAAH